MTLIAAMETEAQDASPTVRAKLAQGSDGNLYGTTDDEGAYEIGTIFVVSPDGSYENDLWSFDYTTGAYPNALR